MSDPTLSMFSRRPLWGRRVLFSALAATALACGETSTPSPISETERAEIRAWLEVAPTSPADPPAVADLRVDLALRDIRRALSDLAVAEGRVASATPGEIGPAVAGIQVHFDELDRAGQALRTHLRPTPGSP